MQVYVTQTGNRYHSRRDQPCLENSHGSVAIDLGLAVDGGLRPCLVCGAPALPDSSEGDRRWLRTIDEWHKAGVFESIWEEAFARRVLARLEQLSADAVEPQAYVNAGTEAFKVDFLIPSHQVVLEIDGYSKSGGSPSQIDMERRNRRDAILQGLGYSVLHFSNAQVEEEPNQCQELVRIKLSDPKLGVDRMSSNRQSSHANSATSTLVSPGDSKYREKVPSASNSSSSPIKWIAGLGALLVMALLAIFALTLAQSDGESADSVTNLEPSSNGAKTADVTSAQSQSVRFVDPLKERDCPSAYAFKANENKLVHPPDNGRFYEQTKPERCYATLEFALEDGYSLPPKYDGAFAN